MIQPPFIFTSPAPSSGFGGKVLLSYHESEAMATGNAFDPRFSSLFPKNCRRKNGSCQEASASSSARGSQTVKMEPFPGSLSSVTLPP